VDTIKILLGAIVALLLGALVMSWKNFQTAERNEPKEKLFEVQRQIEELRQQQEDLRQIRERVTGTAPALAEATNPLETTPAPPQVDLAEIEAASSLADPPTAESVPQPQDTPAPLMPAVDRAQAIASAPVVAKIAEWVEDPALGVIVTLTVTDPAIVKSGSILCVRRNSGILGRLKVGEITPEGAVAETQSNFDALKPKPGDELIIEPPM